MLSSPRSEWFRIEEREHEKVLCPKISVGSWIEHTKTIVRTGYWLEPHDLAIENALNGAKSHFSHYLNKWLAEPNKSIGKWMFYNHPLTIDTSLVSGPIDDEMVSVIASILGVDEEYLLRHLAYRLRGMWLRQEKMKVQPHPTFLRTFWYIEHELVSSQIYGIVNRQVGEHCPGGSYNGYDTELDPPSFDAWTHQQLYHTGYRDYGTRKNEMLYVHPLDIVDGRG